MRRLQPPASGRSHRPGYARRDSNLALFGALFSGVVLLVAILLLLLQRADPTRFGAFRATMTDALAPVTSLARAPIDALRFTGGGLARGWQAIEHNRQLEKELIAARRKARQMPEMQREIERLQALLRLHRPERVLVATGVASSVAPSGATRSAIVSVGREAGVTPRMPAIAPEGLAGRITDTGARASRIMLLSDSMSRVPVLVARTGWAGLAQGTGAALVFVFDVASERDQLLPGDRLVTSGDGGLFPPGIPVGRIVDPRHNPPRIAPAANPESLGIVMIEKAWMEPLATDIPARGTSPTAARPPVDRPPVDRPPADKPPTPPPAAAP